MVHGAAWAGRHGQGLAPSRRWYWRCPQCKRSWLANSVLGRAWMGLHIGRFGWLQGLLGLIWIVLGTLLACFALLLVFLKQTGPGLVLALAASTCGGGILMRLLRQWRRHRLELVVPYELQSEKRTTWGKGGGVSVGGSTIWRLAARHRLPPCNRPSAVAIRRQPSRLPGPRSAPSVPVRWRSPHPDPVPARCLRAARNPSGGPSGRAGASCLAISTAWVSALNGMSSPPSRRWIGGGASILTVWSSA